MDTELSNQDLDLTHFQQLRDLEQRNTYKDIEISNLKRHVKELEHLLFALTSSDKDGKGQKEKSQNYKVVQMQMQQTTARLN